MLTTACSEIGDGLIAVDGADARGRRADFDGDGGLPDTYEEFGERDKRS
jgi:hypothetical protein